MAGGAASIRQMVTKAGWNGNRPQRRKLVDDVKVFLEQKDHDLIENISSSGCYSKEAEFPYLSSAPSNLTIYLAILTINDRPITCTHIQVCFLFKLALILTLHLSNPLFTISSYRYYSN